MSSKSSSIQRENSSRQPTREKKGDTREEIKPEAENCPECDGSIVTNQQERLCDSCGLVFNTEVVDRGPEWRSYNTSEWKKKTRVGAPTDKTLHDNGLSTSICNFDKDGYGKRLSARKSRQMNRLRTWDNRLKTKSSSERNQVKGLNEIRRMASSLGIPDDARETAAILFKQISEEGLLPGRSIEGMASAALYAGARQTGNPRTLDEISQVSRIEKMAIGRSYRYINNEFSLGIPPEQPEKYVPRFLSEVIDKLDSDHPPEKIQQIENMARQLIDIAKGKNLHSGRNPISIAAATIYLASQRCGVNVTQSSLSDTCDVSTVTIRNRYQNIEAIAEKGGQ